MSMITNPKAKVILCYGDSNTWAQKDDKKSDGRYGANIRWTGALQNLLGDYFYIIEEGLASRTTDLEHYNPQKKSRNGLTYFEPCLMSHHPVDMVIIMLGTNDLKLQYSRSSDEIAKALKQYVEIIKADLSSTKILLISPVIINDKAPLYKEYYDGIYNEESATKSKQLATSLERLAKDTGSLFFNASAVSKPGKDGIHFDEKSHLPLATELAKIIKSAYS
jgi:lysophospholipase L1-like esterase